MVFIYKLLFRFIVSAGRRKILGNLHKLLLAGIKENPVALAEIVFVESAVREIPASLAAAAAQPIMRTGPTILRNLSGAGEEADFLTLLVDGIQTILIEISKAEIIQHKEITGVDAAVGLHHILKSAGSALLTGFRHVSGGQSHIVLKGADVGLYSLLKILIPELEKLHQEVAVAFRTQSVGGRLMALV